MGDGEPAMTGEQRGKGTQFAAANQFWPASATIGQPIGTNSHAFVLGLAPWAVEEDGWPTLGVLACAGDVACGDSLVEAVWPDTTATASLGVHRLIPPATGDGPSGSVVAIAKVVRVGSRLLTARFSAYDTAGTSAEEVLDGLDAQPDEPPAGVLLAVGRTTFLRIPTDPETSAGHAEARAVLRDRYWWPEPDDTSDRPASPADLVRRDASLPNGVVDLAYRARMANPKGALSGGVYCSLFEEAARTAVPGLWAVDLTVDFLAGTRGHEVRTTPDIVRRAPHHGLCTVESRDLSNGRVLATGSVNLVAT